jgi:hypothetical protein
MSATIAYTIETVASLVPEITRAIISDANDGYIASKKNSMETAHKEKIMIGLRPNESLRFPSKGPEKNSSKYLPNETKP